MKTYVLLFLLSAGVSFALTPALLWLAGRYRWLDVPDGHRKIHTKPVPRLGGVAIFIAFNLTLLLSFLTHGTVFDAFRWDWERVVFILLPSTFIFLVGLYDDLRGLSARKKLALQLVAAGLLYYNGFRIEHLANPFGDAPISLGWLSVPVTLLWIVGVTNAFNLIDGMDGLAAGIAFFASVASFFVALAQGKTMICVLSVIMAGGTLGFLRFNFNPARIFMGDGGSYFLGFVLGALAIKGSQKSSTMVSIAVPILLLGLPILDMALAVARRFLEGKPLFAPDRQHIHHRLLRIAQSQRFAVIILYGATAFLGLLSWMLVVIHSRLVAVTSLVAGLAAFWGIKSLGYEEFQELGHYLSNLSSHRSTLAQQIYLRRLADRMTAASDLTGVLTIAEEALQRLDFDRAEIYLAAAAPELPHDGHAAAVRNYRWSWNPTAAAKSPARPMMWELHIPLSDIPGRLGYLRLERSVAKGSLPVQLASMIQVLVMRLSTVMAPAAENPLNEALAVAAPAPENLHQMEVGTRA